ncbi:MAG: hypothetical protein JO366_13230 [Methylobacteriaceae bacterium]|nr:hypothetical protein [Methylobacteriaceae bacterium]MBV9245766.1 hypothetical protein [Methylobacteriaceae bacterium]
MTMTLNAAMQQFRIASRELFNNYFRVDNPYNNNGWAMEEGFAEVQQVLFRRLVTEPLSLSSIIYGKVNPEIGVELLLAKTAPIMLNRDLDSGYWDYPLTEINTDPILVFVGFFDWDQLTCRDNQYVRVRVQKWPAHSEVVGKHGLIESQYVQFVKLAQHNQEASE